MALSVPFLPCVAKLAGLCADHYHNRETYLRKKETKENDFRKKGFINPECG